MIFITNAMMVSMVSDGSALTVASIVPTNGSSVVATDLDGDGLVDVATQGAVHTGHGDGTFATIGIAIPPGGGGDHFAADVTGDGVLDLVSSAGESQIAVQRGLGSAAFASAWIYNTQWRGWPAFWTQDIAVADLDHDGRVEVITSSAIIQRSGCTATP